jgi:hypothetical protein
MDVPELVASNGFMTRRNCCNGIRFAHGTKLLLGLALFGGAMAWAADPVPMDVKTGQWEYTVTTQMTGMPQTAQQMQMPSIPPEQLAKIPPEQRAKIEAAMKQASAMGSGKPMTTTSKSCIRKEDLAKMMPNGNKDQSCKVNLVSSSRTKQELKMDCESNGGKQTGTVVVEALSSESTKFNLQIASNQDGHAMNMTVNGTSKWLGATCTDAK